MTTVKVKSLLLIGGMILTMTACAQSSPQTDSVNTDKEPPVQEENKEEEKGQEEEEEKDQAAASEEKQDDTAGKKETKISKSKASLFDPKQIWE